MTIEDNLNNMLESNVNPNKDETVPQEVNYEETRNKHKSRVPKNHPISNVIGNANERVVT